MTPQEQANADLMLTILRAIERRDRGLLQKLYHPEIEFHWQPGLPYGGFFTGATVPKMQERFASIWFPLQPTEERRRMDARVIATSTTGREIVNYVWKGLSPDGVAFETETLADYAIEKGQLRRAQMFYYDLFGLMKFLNHCGIG